MKRRGRPRTTDVLTPRQQEVLSLLQRGYSNREIADELEISLAGAKFHVSEIISRLGVSSRKEAAEWRPRKQLVLLPIADWAWARLKQAPVAKSLAVLGSATVSVLVLFAFLTALANRDPQVVAQTETITPTPTTEERAITQGIAYGQLAALGQGVLTLEDPATGTTLTVIIDDQTEVTRPSGHAVVTDNDAGRLRVGDRLGVHILPDRTPITAKAVWANFAKAMEVIVDAHDESGMTGRVNEGISGGSSPIWSSATVRVIEVSGATDVGGMRPVSDYQAGERLMLHAYIADDGTIIPIRN